MFTNKIPIAFVHSGDFEHCLFLLEESLYIDFSLAGIFKREAIQWWLSSSIIMNIMH